MNDNIAFEQQLVTLKEVFLVRTLILKIAKNTYNDVQSKKLYT